MEQRLTAVAAAHAVVAAVHGIPHGQAGVWLAGWQYAVVAGTVVAPFAGARVADGRPVRGGVAFAAAMSLSVAFGVAHHWLLAGVDNVRRVSVPHHATFEGTAVALAAIGAVGVLAGLGVAYSRSAT